MPSKKRKYNARFPAGRIKKIMQTDEEVGKVAQAVPIIISRTLELFVESLLTKAMQVTISRNSKTLSPSHVKQCILAESRFDFLKDLVKNIPDVSAAEEKEMTSAESSPNSSRFADGNLTRRLAREDSTTSTCSEPKTPQPQTSDLKRPHSLEIETINKIPKLESPSPKNLTTDIIDLSVKTDEKFQSKTPNFYQETLNLDDDLSHGGVIKLNPSYSAPSTSTFMSLKPVPPLHRLPIESPKTPVDSYKTPLYKIDLVSNVNTSSPSTPVTPIFNIDFTKNFSNPEIKMLDTNVKATQNSKHKPSKSGEVVPRMVQPVDLDYLNSGNLQIDEDYDT